jgi:hypothetical protein
MSEGVQMLPNMVVNGNLPDNTHICDVFDNDLKVWQTSNIL